MELEQKNIKNILEGNRMVVPEIQRDYVWGDKKNISKLLAFVSDLQNGLKVDNKNVGFMYSYLSHKSEHYIIDGQQRFTTIILLLYVLANKENRLDDFRRLLNVDEPTMKFCYNVRPLTEQFLPLLFREVYPTDDSIQDKIWYISAYDSDMTIRSILNAVKNLYHQNYSCTYDDILERVYFWYFDVAQTSQGEELYISMNSRGQKLVDHEQIKPRLFDNLKGDSNLIHDFGKKWDNWEEFFFSNRGSAPFGTDDIALNNFLQISIELNQHEEVKTLNPIEYAKCISLEKIEKYFNILENLVNMGLIEDVVFQSLYSPNRTSTNLFQIEALIGTFDTLRGNQQELGRVSRVVKNTLKYYPNTSIKNLFYFIESINQEDFYTCVCENHEKFIRKKIEKDNIQGFIPKVEYEKILGIHNKLISEEKIIEAESFAFFDGRIQFLYQNENGEIDWEHFHVKFLNAQKFFDTNGIKEEYNQHGELFRLLVSYFEKWEDFSEIYYDLSKENVYSILLNSKIQSSVAKLLLTDSMPDLSNFESTYDLSTSQKQLQMEIVTTSWIKDIADWSYLRNPWADGKYHFLKYNGKVDWRNYYLVHIRNYVLSYLQSAKAITSNQCMPCGFYWGTDIYFKFKNYSFKWTVGNNIYLCGEDRRAFKKTELANNGIDKYYGIEVESIQNDVDFLRQEIPSMLSNIIEEYENTL